MDNKNKSYIFVLSVTQLYIKVINNTEKKTSMLEGKSFYIATKYKSKKKKAKDLKFLKLSRVYMIYIYIVKQKKTL